MCHTQQTQDMPVGSMPNPNPDDPLSKTLTDSWNGQQTNPLTAATVPVTHDTKFGSLMKVLQPALEGGLIGWAGGKGHPGGGFGAANDFYMRQRTFDMQRSMLARQLYNDQFKNMLEAARTQHEVNLPPLTRIPNAIKGKDANGNEIFQTLNPRTMQWEPVEGISPDRAPDKFTFHMTDKGLVSGDTDTGAVKLAGLGNTDNAEPGPDGNAPTPGGTIPTRPIAAAAKALPSKFNSGSPETPGTASQSPQGVAAVMPLHAPNFGTAKPVIRSSRNASGTETDSMYDENPNSPTFGQKIKSLGNSRAPLPDRTEGRQEKKTALDAQIENYAAEALKQNANDPNKAITYLNGLKNTDPNIQKSFSAILPKIRQRIRERTRQGKNRLQLSPQDAAAAGLSPTTQGVMDEDENPDNE